MLKTVNDIRNENGIEVATRIEFFNTHKEKQNQTNKDHTGYNPVFEFVNSILYIL